MQLAELRSRTTASLLEFAWGEWAQLGVFAAPGTPRRTAQDPEALLIFTLGIARHDPRLFDELLDWLRLNGDLVSGRRLARLLGHRADAALVAAGVQWAHDHGSTLRLASQPVDHDKPQLVFPALRTPIQLDAAFQAHGYLKAPTTPSYKSARPDTSLPINFAFRLRGLFGVGARAEIVRFLLTSGVQHATTLAIADAAGSVKRNTSDALTGLVASGQVRRHTTGNAAWYGLDRHRWAEFLGLAERDLPGYRDWPRLLGPLAEVDRWLNDPRHEVLDDYLRASEARRLMSGLSNTLAQAGVGVLTEGTGADYWPSFVASVDALMAALRA